MMDQHVNARHHGIAMWKPRGIKCKQMTLVAAAKSQAGQLSMGDYLDGQAKVSAC